MNITTANNLKINLHQNYGQTIDEIVSNVKNESAKNKQHPGYADALDVVTEKWYLLSVDDSGNLIGKLDEPNIDPKLSVMTMTDGYVGGMGKTWKTPTAETLEQAIVGAMEIEGKSRDEIIALLGSGSSVRWCKSPNFSYDHSYGVIGTKRADKSIRLVDCDCGHTVPVGQRMSASLGTSCFDCYDRMSN